LIARARAVVSEAIALDGEHPGGYFQTKGRIKDALSRFFYEETRRRPMILPVVLEA
jgi:ribonuclease J